MLNDIEELNNGHLREGRKRVHNNSWGTMQVLHITKKEKEKSRGRI